MTIQWKEYPELIWINLVVKVRQLIEFWRVLARYYSHKQFRKCDLAVLRKYFFTNPYTVSKEFLIAKGEQEVYAYGETPLTTLERIVRASEITKQDTFFELGCGRGRSCFWVRCFVECSVVGVEYIPTFVEKARQVVQEQQMSQIDFRAEDMLQTDYSGATVIYLYGTCYEEPFLKKLLKRFAKLPKGTKFITVSYPLSDYGTGYVVEQKITEKFTWGQADVYIQVKK